MRNLHKYFILLLFLFLTFSIRVFSEDNLFKKRLKEAKKGDFVVFEYNKLYSSLSVFEIDTENNRVILEEIIIPKDSFDKKLSFRDWIEKKANESTSWTMYEIDLSENKIIDTYSVSRNCFIDLKNQISITAKLLDLELNKLLDRDRKKIGPPPSVGEVDRRAFWQPMKYIDGKRIKRAKFNVYRSIWPDDSSELSLKRFDIYFDKNFVFPYFIEVNNGHMSYMIKGVDSGKNLKSSISFFPKRAAEITDLKKKDDNLTIFVKNANQYKNFSLYAIDTSRKDKMIHPLEFEMEKEKDLVFLNVDLKIFNKIFEKNHKYRFVLAPDSAQDIYIESRDLFVWR
ncbi:MAG: hypothetical protein KR126chlam4_00951 [Candidatus Anoxychlamydiales bacterium]|nr:hypothetical protein [Candidatus Anoxychlamydiales bacterium]